MTQENTMQFPFETTTNDGRKATVLGVMPDDQLCGFIQWADGTFSSAQWNSDGSATYYRNAITLPLQIKPLTTYRMRNGQLAWTSGLIKDGWIYGMIADGNVWSWRVKDGRRRDSEDTNLDLIEELPPGTKE